MGKMNLLPARGALSSIQPQGTIVILARPNYAVDNDCVSSHRIEHAVATVGTSPNAVLLVAWNQRKGARHVAYALGDVLQLRNKSHRPARIIFCDVATDQHEIIAGVARQKNFH